MAINNKDGTFSCSYCGEIYSSAQFADRCRDSHNLVYVPMTRKEFNLLIHAVQFEDMSIIPESLRATFRKIQRSVPND